METKRRGNSPLIWLALLCVAGLMNPCNLEQGNVLCIKSTKFSIHLLGKPAAALSGLQCALSLHAEALSYIG